MTVTDSDGNCYQVLRLGGDTLHFCVGWCPGTARAHHDPTRTRLTTPKSALFWSLHYIEDTCTIIKMAVQEARKLPGILLSKV